MRDYGVRGMRSIASPNGGFDHAGVRALWKTALEQGIVINILITNQDPDMDKRTEFDEVFEPYVLGEIRELVDQAKGLLDEFFSLPVVLDHCLNLKAGPDLELWLTEVIRLSEHQNLNGKVSFVATGTKTGLDRKGASGAATFPVSCGPRKLTTPIIFGSSHMISLSKRVRGPRSWV